MAYRKLQLSKVTLIKLAEALFLAFTEDQAATLAGISKSTLIRIRKSEAWKEIEQKRLDFEKPFRRKVWNGAVGWQGAAWMLERQYAAQLSKPELQLQVNASSTTTNNVLVITAEQASHLRHRTAAIEADLNSLATPASKRVKDASTDQVIEPGNLDPASEASEGDPPRSHAGAPAHPRTRTPRLAGSQTTPYLGRNSELSDSSSNSKKAPQVPRKSEILESSSNYKEPSSRMRKHLGKGVRTQRKAPQGES